MALSRLPSLSELSSYGRRRTSAQDDDLDVYARGIESWKPPAPFEAPPDTSLMSRAKRVYGAIEQAPAVAASYYADAPGGFDVGNVHIPNPFRAAADLISPTGPGPANQALSEQDIPGIGELVQTGAQTPDQQADDTYGGAIYRKVAGTGLEMAASPTNAAILLGLGGLGGLAGRGATARAAMGAEGFLVPEAAAAAGKAVSIGRAAELAQRGVSLGFASQMAAGAGEKIGQAYGRYEQEGFTPGVAGDVAGAALETGFAGLAGHHGVSERPIRALDREAAERPGKIGILEAQERLKELQQQPAPAAPPPVEPVQPIGGQRGVDLTAEDVAKVQQMRAQQKAQAQAAAQAQAMAAAAPPMPVEPVAPVAPAPAPALDIPALDAAELGRITPKLGKMTDAELADRLALHEKYGLANSAEAVKAEIQSRAEPAVAPEAPAAPGPLSAPQIGEVAPEAVPPDLLQGRPATPPEGPVLETPQSAVVASEAAPAALDRRTDPTMRKRVADMTDEEKHQALFTDHRTGLANDRAFDEDAEHPDFGGGVASMDISGLKWFNDTHGHPAGNEILASVVKALSEETGVKAYAGGKGDEFFLRGKTPQHVEAAGRGIQERLARSTVEATRPDGTKVRWTGLRLDYGVGDKASSADAALYENRRAAVERGERLDTNKPENRGQRPLGLVDVVAEGDHVQGPPRAEAATAVGTPTFKEWLGDRRVPNDPNYVKGLREEYLKAYPDADRGQFQAGRGPVQPAFEAPAELPVDVEGLQARAAQEARDLVPDADVDRDLTENVGPALARGIDKGQRRAGINSIKPQLGIEGVAGDPKALVKAIKQDADNPKFLELREARRAAMADELGEFDPAKFDDSSGAPQYSVGKKPQKFSVDDHPAAESGWKEKAAALVRLAEKAAADGDLRRVGEYEQRLRSIGASRALGRDFGAKVGSDATAGMTTAAADYVRSLKPEQYSTGPKPSPEEAVLRAIREENPQAEGGALGYMPKVRARAGLPRDVFDETVRSLREKGEIQTQAHPTPDRLTAAERADMVQDTPRLKYERAVKAGKITRAQADEALKTWEKSGKKLDEPEHHMAIGLLKPEQYSTRPSPGQRGLEGIGEDVARPGEKAKKVESAVMSPERGPGDKATKPSETPGGGNKIVDSAGKPLTVYHGTAADFSSFEPQKIGGDAGGGLSGNWFTDSKSHAGTFGRVGAYKLDIRNPAHIDAKKPSALVTHEDVAAFDRGGWEADGRLSGILARAKELGHDGAVVSNWEGPGKNYIAFDPKQIRRIARDVESTGWPKLNLKRLSDVEVSGIPGIVSRVTEMADGGKEAGQIAGEVSRGLGLAYEASKRVVDLILKNRSFERLAPERGAQRSAKPGEQTSIEGTTRPESAPLVRTEGREGEGKLFTQDADARARAEKEAQGEVKFKADEKAPATAPAEGGLTLKQVQAHIRAPGITETQEGFQFDVRQVGRTVGVRIDRVGDIHLDPKALAQGRPGAKASELQALGSYQRVGPLSTIKLLAKEGETKRTLLHEIWHLVKDLGLLSEKEFRKVEEKYGKNEEAQADAYADWNPKERPDGMFQKIQSFFRNIYRSFRPSAESAFEKVRSGRAYERAGDGAGPRVEQAYMAAAKAVGDRVENFRRWFGESKVVDEKGGPLRVYHGARSGFTAFDEGRIGSRPGSQGGGFWFVRDPKVAVNYSETQTGAPNIMPVFLSLKNPLVIDTTGRQFDSPGESLGTTFRREAIEAAKAGGHDGLILKGHQDFGTADTYLAFKPEQIKSATGNRGTFDAKNPDIRYATAPKEPPDFGPKVKPIPDKKEAVPERELGRPMLPGEAHRVDTKVADLKEVKPNVKLARDAPRTWESLDPEIRKKLEDITADSEKETAFYEKVTSGKINDVEVMTLDALVAGKRESYESMVSKLTEAQTAGRETGPENVALLSAALDRATAELAKAARSDVQAGTRLGRALAARARVMDAAGKSTPDQFLKRVFREIPGTSDAQATELVRIMRDRPSELADAIRALTKPSFFRKWLEFYKAGLLSGIPTHVANTVGNALEQSIRLAETATAAGVERAIGSGPRERFASEAGAELAGAGKAVGPAFSNLSRSFRDIFTLKPEALNMGAKFDNQVGAIAGRPGRLVRIPFRLLDSADTFFKEIGGEAELGKLAYRKAATELRNAPDAVIRKRALKIMEEVRSENSEQHQDIVKAIVESKKERTFQQDPGEIANTFLRLSQSHPALQLIAPFVRTPTNLAKVAIARSPFGLIDAAKAYHEYKAGKITSGVAADRIAKPLLGTAMFITAYGVARGIAPGLSMTGSGPVDPRENALWKDTGAQPYSFVIDHGDGKKTYIPMNRFEPLSTAFGVVADLAETKDQKNATDAASKVIGTIGNNLTNKTFLQGVTDFAAMVKNPTEFAGQYARNFGGSLVPTLVAKATQAIDPVVRETKAESTGFAGMPEGVFNQIQSRLPGVSQLLPERKSATGETVERPGNAFSRFVSPVQVSETKAGTELEQLLVDIGYPPSTPRREVTIPTAAGKSSVKVRLSDEEYETLQVAQKRAADFIRKNYLNSPQFQRLPGTIEEGGSRSKEALIKKVFDRAHDDSRRRLYLLPSFKTRAVDARRAVLTQIKQGSV